MPAAGGKKKSKPTYAYMTGYTHTHTLTSVTTQIVEKTLSNIVPKVVFNQAPLPVECTTQQGVVVSNGTERPLPFRVALPSSPLFDISVTVCFCNVDTVLVCVTFELFFFFASSAIEWQSAAKRECRVFIFDHFACNYDVASCRSHRYWRRRVYIVFARQCRTIT
jgi:hypothetical protein